MMLNSFQSIVNPNTGGNFIELEQITNVETAHAYMFMPDGETVESISQKYVHWRTVIVISFGGSQSSVRFKLPDRWMTYEPFNIYQHNNTGRADLLNGEPGVSTFNVTPLPPSDKVYDFAIVSSGDYDDGTVSLYIG